MAGMITRRVTTNLLLGVVLTIVTIVGATLWMADRQNTQAADSARTMVIGGVTALESNIQGFANDYSWWQAGYDAVVTGDMEWIEENFGSAITDTQIADTIMIISTSSEIFYVRALDSVPTPPELVYTQEVVDDIVLLARDMPHTFDAARVGYVRDGNEIILLAVNRITPVTLIDEEVDIDPHSLPLLVQAIYLNEERLEEVGERFLIDDLHLYIGQPTEEILDGDFPLIHDMDGEVIGAFVWTPPKPGSAVLKNVVLPIGGAILIFIIIVLSSAVGTRKIAQALSKSSRDLTHSEHELEKQLEVVASEQERIETIVMSVGEGMLVAGADGKVFMSNEAASFILGKSEKEILGNSFKEVFNVQQAIKDSPSAPALNVLKRKSTVRIEEANFIRGDGEVVVLSLTATPVERNKKLVGAVIVFHDVTEQKLVSLAKNQFVTTAAHQFRTPLTGMRWSLNLLLEGTAGALQKEQKKIVQQIEESVMRMNDLVNDLLNTDKFESEKRELMLVPTDVNQLIAEIVSELQPLIAKKNIQVAFSETSDLQQLKVDVGLIKIAFQNLIDNAIKYSHKGGTVTVELEKEGANVHLRVVDEGIGIPRNQQKSVFSRFFRANNAPSFEPDGSGLGLFITKQIIEQHGGKIWFESEVGKGTVFHVVLRA